MGFLGKWSIKNDPKKIISAEMKEIGVFQNAKFGLINCILFYLHTILHFAFS